jgi:dihydroflavonol-4-reductase
MYREAGLPESIYHDVNATGTQRLLQASLENGVKRFVHCSTVGVLGNIADPPANEKTPYNPGDEYQRSKMGGEMAALEFYRKHRFPVSVIRPAAIYGPGDMRLLKLFRMVARGRAMMLGDGQTLYHLVYVDDLVQGFRCAARTDRASGEVFIIGHDGYVTLNALYEMVARALGVPLKVVRLPVRPVKALASLLEAVFPPIGLRPPLYRRRVDFFTKNRAFDISKAKDVLRFKPSLSLEEGIARAAAWYREKGLL